MFAPGQQRVADEVARVMKSGDRVAIRAWTPESGVGRMFRVVSKYVPPPQGVPSPFGWGEEEQVKSLLGQSFDAYRFERYDCPEYADTPTQVADLFISQCGPTSVYHSLLEKDEGEAEAFRNDLTELYRGYITPADGKVRWGEYIITLATRT
jgi:hypothetical protein